MLWTGSESPVVVVLSGSMEPGYQRGDILFLRLNERPFTTGEGEQMLEAHARAATC